MAILLPLLFLFTLLLIILRFNGARAQAKNANQPPSPAKLPIIGNLHQLGFLPHRSLRALSHKHGPLMLFNLGSVPNLVVSSADMAEMILKAHDLAFSSRSTSKAARQLFYGCRDVAFAPYGEYWRQVRKTCVLELLSVKRVQSFACIREEEVANTVKEISGSCSTSAINLSDMLLALSSGIISRIAFGKKYTGRGEDGKNRIAILIKELTVLLGAFSMADYFPWLEWVDVLTGLNARLKRNAQGLDRFFDQVIEEHLIRRANGRDDENEDFVDLLLQIQKDSVGNGSLSRDSIKALILDMFAAGTDTTATLVEWAMAELVKSPHVMEKAQAEVRRVVGRNQKVEEAHLLRMDYLKSIIKETLRLHPPLPLLVPHESTASVTIQGYHIPPKTKVLINAWAIGTDPKSWENADAFIPERFTKKEIDFKGQDFQLIPFGSGRRSCPGISFATSVVELVLANLLYWFDWELPGGANKEDLDMSEAPGLTVHKKSALHLVPIYHFS